MAAAGRLTGAASGLMVKIPGMDELLLSLIRAAEDGRPRPEIRVVTSGGDLLIGTPAARDEFSAAMRGELTRAYADYFNSRSRRERRDDPQDPAAAADEVAESFAVPPSSRADDAMLTLAPARVTWSGRSDGMAVPAIRVALSSIAAWWVCGGTDIANASGTTWAFGAVIPLGE
jgi:hypothetical protein